MDLAEERQGTLCGRSAMKIILSLTIFVSPDARVALAGGSKKSVDVRDHVVQGSGTLDDVDPRQ